MKVIQCEPEHRRNAQGSDRSHYSCCWDQGVRFLLQEQSRRPCTGHLAGTDAVKPLNQMTNTFQREGGGGGERGREREGCFPVEVYKTQK